MTRHFPLPSFMSIKRSRGIAIAAAGALALATAVSLTATLPAGSAPARAATAHQAATAERVAAPPARPVANGVAQALIFSRARSIQDERQQEAAAQQVAARKAAAAKADAKVDAKAASVKAAKQTAVKQNAAKQAAKATVAARRAAGRAAVTTPSGSPEQIAEQMLSQFGWSSSQFSCLQPLWEHESGWNVTAENPTSGAYGIPQALPSSQLASAGADWQTSAVTQIRWGLTYIQGRYGSPCAAWSHEESTNWY